MVRHFSPIIFFCWSIPVATRSKVCGRSPAEIMDSSASGDMSVCLSVCCECCVLCIDRVDHSSRVVLPNVMCPMSVNTNQMRGGKDARYC